jgi:hypothetical protein
MANNEDRLIARVVAAVRSWLQKESDSDPRDADGDGKVTRRERAAARKAEVAASREARRGRSPEERGLLPGMNRQESLNARLAAQARDEQAANPPAKDEVAPPAEVDEPNFAEKLAANFEASAKAHAEVEAMLEAARSSAIDDFNEGVLGGAGERGLPGMGGETNLVRPPNEKNIGKATNLNPQPGFITVRAEDEGGNQKCFDVLGYEADDCGTGPAPRTVWWEPTFGFGTGSSAGVGTGAGTGDGPPSVSIAKGLNLVPSTNADGEHHPTTLWKDLYTAENGTHELTLNATNYVWVKVTYYEREVLVADKIWHVEGKEDYDIDVDFAFEFTGTGSGTGTGPVEWSGGLDCGSGYGVGSGEDCECCDIPVTGTGYASFTGANSLKVEVAGAGTGTGSGSGYTYKPDTFLGSIKQYLLYTSNPPEVVTPITTSSTAPADTKNVKYQLLGQVTLDAQGRVTSWEWRMNHAFYWNAPDFVAGTLGKTKTTLPNYVAPKITT